jgi:ABC-type dipeptide/oligopeptide/nickel transport system permease subunit
MFQRSNDVRVAAGGTEVEDAVVIEGKSLWRLGWRRLKQDRVALAGGVALIVILLVATFASQLIEWYGHPPSRFNSNLINNDTTMPVGNFGGISTSHWLGVEPVNGRDVLARLLAGLRTSLVIALSATLISLVLGTVLGMVSAYYGGLFDTIMVLVLDVLLAFPGLLTAVTLVTILSQSPEILGLSGANLNFVLVIAVLGFFGFAYLARLVRGQVISLREQEFVLAARSLGASDLRIMTKELLPNLMGPLLVCTTLAVPTNILAESAMSYLGLGVQSPTASWGGMISSAQAWYEADPMSICCPGLALFITVLAFNLFGDGLRDAFDPRSTQ